MLIICLTDFARTSYLAASTATPARHGEIQMSIEIANQDLSFRPVAVAGLQPTGAEVAAAAGFSGAGQPAVLHLLADGALHHIRIEETIDVSQGEHRFVVLERKREFHFMLNGDRFDWPFRVISGGQIRKLGRVPPDLEIWLVLERGHERLINDHDLVDLEIPGHERFISRRHEWKLNVQGVILEVPEPTIVVRKAISDAGFDPNKDWQIFLIVHGQPKKPVTLTDTIDLRTPGIDKLRLTPKEVNNGEALPAPRRAFSLLDVDELHLNRLGLLWETVEEARRRWLVIHDYPLPAGYTVRRTLLALEIPTTYPAAQIYGFFAFPPLALASNRAIASTQLRGTIFGSVFHGWSRNRGAARWNPATDNVSTQLALVDAALAKEAGE
jgi:hypothetical protein